MWTGISVLAFSTHLPCAHAHLVLEDSSYTALHFSYRQSPISSRPATTMRIKHRKQGGRSCSWRVSKPLRPWNMLQRTRYRSSFFSGSGVCRSALNIKKNGPIRADQSRQRLHIIYSAVSNNLLPQKLMPDCLRKQLSSHRAVAWIWPPRYLGGVKVEPVECYEKGEEFVERAVKPRGVVPRRFAKPALTKTSRILCTRAHYC